MRNTILVLGFALASVNAFAGSITFSGSFGPTTNPFTTITNLSAFDPALGTLTSITFSISGQSSGTIAVTNNSSASSNYDVTINANLRFQDPSNNILVSVLPFFEDPSFAVGAGATRSDSGTSGSSTNAATIFSGFTPYVGTAHSPGTLAFSVRGSGSFGADGATPVSVTATTAGVGTDSVTYNFTAPSSTPEPATITLFGSALVGLGFLARKRSKKA